MQAQRHGESDGQVLASVGKDSAELLQACSKAIEL